MSDIFFHLGLIIYGFQAGLCYRAGIEELNTGIKHWINYPLAIIGGACWPLFVFVWLGIKLQKLFTERKAGSK